MWTASTIQIMLKNTHLKAVFVRVFFFHSKKKGCHHICVSNDAVPPTFLLQL